MAIQAESLLIKNYNLTLPNAYVEIVGFQWQKQLASNKASLLMHAWASIENAANKVQPFEIFVEIEFNESDTIVFETVKTVLEDKIIASLPHPAIRIPTLGM